MIFSQLSWFSDKAEDLLLPLCPGGLVKQQTDYTKDIQDLLDLGRQLHRRPRQKEERTPSIFLAEKLLKVRDREGRERELRANNAQIAFELNRETRNIVLKARQMGVTTWIAGRFFLKTITARGVLSVQIAHTREAAQGIFRIVQRFWLCLPEQYREGVLRRDIANIGAMRFPELDSEFRVLSASDPNAGRGLTMQNLHCSEVSRWPGNAAETLAGLRAALAPGGELVLESTPNGAYGAFHDEWVQAVDPGASGERTEHPSEAIAVRHFFPWWLEPSYVAAPVLKMTADEEELVLQQGLTRAQIGFRRGLEAGFRQLRSQEYAEDPETCFRATGDCCFDIEAIEARLRTVGCPLEVRRNGSLQIWLPPQPDKKYLLGVDSAGGGSEGDFAAIQVIEIASGLQCAELQQRLKPLDLARIAMELAGEYGDALIAVERNNHGTAVLADLRNGRYPHLYGDRDAPGWLTSAASKPMMVSRLGSLLEKSPEIFSSRRLLNECRTFVASEGGRTGAANGAHDDCFMAMAVAQAVRAEILNRRK